MFWIYDFFLLKNKRKNTLITNETRFYIDSRKLICDVPLFCGIICCINWKTIKVCTKDKELTFKYCFELCWLNYELITLADSWFTVNWMARTICEINSSIHLLNCLNEWEKIFLQQGVMVDNFISIRTKLREFAQNAASKLSFL